MRQQVQQRSGKDWLVGLDSRQFWREVKQFSQELSGPESKTGLVLIAEADSLKFLSRFLVACSQGCSVILANPHWGKRQWEQVSDLLQGESLQFPVPKILIPTGGSSGQLKFVVHTWQTLTASVTGFQSHFGLTQVNAYCVLPLFHVSGLMQVMRVWLSDGTLVLQPYRALKQGKILPLPAPGFLSLVPTQLQGLLDQGNGYLPWLRNFRAVLLGGAPPWPSLLQKARAAEVPVALTYGMTETASQVATLLPEQFLAGGTSSGRSLPHAQIHILGDQGDVLAPGATGRVAIGAESLGLGYVLLPDSGQEAHKEASQFSGEGGWARFNPWAVEVDTPASGGAAPGLFVTDDMGFLDSDGELYIVGRCSSKLITGGENVFPEEVEAVLLTLADVRDACVVGLPDERWGQRLCAVVTLTAGRASLEEISCQIKTQLALYKHPKDWIAVNNIPRTAQGKVNRRQTLELARKILGSYDQGSFP